MSEEKTEQETQATPEQVKAYKEKMKKYYEEQIPYLKKVKEYETLLADIEEQRAKRTDMTLRIAHMMNPSQEVQQEISEEEKAEFEKYREEIASKRGEQTIGELRTLKKVKDGEK